MAIFKIKFKKNNNQIVKYFFKTIRYIFLSGSPIFLKTHIIFDQEEFGHLVLKKSSMYSILIIFTSL